jgi:hypothetical protein
VLMKNFGNQKSRIEDVCAASVKAYARAYSDCIFNDDTNTAPVTLSALNLRQINTIARPLKRLAALLQSAASDEKAASAIYHARKEAHGFVGGIFVDICDFCDKLRKYDPVSAELKKTCKEILLAIQSRDPKAACVVANKALKSNGCNGLSIYFPYLQDSRDKNQVERHLVKGPGGDAIGKLSDRLNGGGPGNSNGNANGNHSGKNGGKGPGGDAIGKNVTIINDAAISAQYAVRREIIQDTEKYYQDKKHFEFEKAIGWYKFIKRGWSLILARNEPGKLDSNYSAQQCVQNLFS